MSLQWHRGGRVVFVVVRGGRVQWKPSIARVRNGVVKALMQFLALFVAEG